MSNPKIATSGLLDGAAVSVTALSTNLVACAECVARAILRGETFVALIGEPTSTGRALAALVASFQSTTVDFVCVAHPGASVDAIRRIIDQLRRTDSDSDDEGWAAPRTVLVFQQAEWLLDEVLEFLNLSAATDIGNPLLRFLFVGQPAFLSRLDGAAFNALRSQIVTRVAVADPPALPEPREHRASVMLASPGPSWRRSANRLAMRVQNAILLGLAIAAAVATGAIVQQRHREPALPTAASAVAAMPAAQAPAADNRSSAVTVVLEPSPEPAQPEPIKPAISARTSSPPSRPVIARAPLGGHRRPDRQYSAAISNPEPPSVHELLQSARAALAGNNAQLARGLLESAETAVVFQPGGNGKAITGVAAAQITQALSELNNGDRALAYQYVGQAVAAVGSGSLGRPYSLPPCCVRFSAGGSLRQQTPLKQPRKTSTVLRGQSVLQQD